MDHEEEYLQIEYKTPAWVRIVTIIILGAICGSLAFFVYKGFTQEPEKGLEDYRKREIERAPTIDTHPFFDSAKPNVSNYPKFNE